MPITRAKQQRLTGFLLDVCVVAPAVAASHVNRFASSCLSVQDKLLGGENSQYETPLVSAKVTACIGVLAVGNTSNDKRIAAMGSRKLNALDAIHLT